MSKYKFIMMSCGYAESNTTSWLLYGTDFYNHLGFDTMASAITELSTDLYEKYNYQYNFDLDECCRDKLIIDNNIKFCSDCGKPIKNKNFDEEEFKKFVCELHTTTCDSYGEAECAGVRDLVWWPWGIHEFMSAPNDSVIFIAEGAEEVILQALLDSKPELRTKEINKSFINWETDWEKFKKNLQPSYL